MVNSLTRVIIGNIASKKNPVCCNKTSDHSNQNLSLDEEQSLLSIINENKKLNIEKKAINQPRNKTMVTLAQLSGKKSEEETFKPNSSYNQEKEFNSHIQKISLEDMSKKYKAGSKKKR